MNSSARYAVPLELIEPLVSTQGMTMMVRARMRWARFRPLAHVSVRAGRFVAEIDYEQPLGPERESGLVVMLTVSPDARRAQASADAAAPLAAGGRE